MPHNYIGRQLCWKLFSIYDVCFSNESQAVMNDFRKNTDEVVGSMMFWLGSRKDGLYFATSDIFKLYLDSHRSKIIPGRSTFGDEIKW